MIITVIFVRVDFHVHCTGHACITVMHFVDNQNLHIRLIGLWTTQTRMIQKSLISWLCELFNNTNRTCLFLLCLTLRFH